MRLWWVLEERVCRRPLVRLLVPEALVTVVAAPGFLSTSTRARPCVATRWYCCCKVGDSLCGSCNVMLPARPPHIVSVVARKPEHRLELPARVCTLARWSQQACTSLPMQRCAGGRTAWCTQFSDI